VQLVAEQVGMIQHWHLTDHDEELAKVQKVVSKHKP